VAVLVSHQANQPQEQVALAVAVMEQKVGMELLQQ
jgi:hypothetical protein